MYHSFFSFFLFFGREKQNERTKTQKLRRNFESKENWKRGNDAISFNCKTTITHTGQRNALLMATCKWKRTVKRSKGWRKWRRNSVNRYVLWIQACEDVYPFAEIWKQYLYHNIENAKWVYSFRGICVVLLYVTNNCLIDIFFY